MGDIIPKLNTNSLISCMSEMNSLINAINIAVTIIDITTAIIFLFSIF